MNTNQDLFLLNLWRDMCGLPEIEIPEYSRKILDIDSLRITEWSPEFEQLRQNRLIFGAFRYGLLGAKNKPQWDRLSRMEDDIKQYRIDGNDERLVDIANHAMLEFKEGVHPKKHFSSLSENKHCERVDKE